MQKCYEATGVFVNDAHGFAFTLSKSYVCANKTEAYNAFREEASELLDSDTRAGRVTVGKGVKIESEVEFEEEEDSVAKVADFDEDPVEDRMVEVASEVAEEMAVEEEAA